MKIEKVQINPAYVHFWSQTDGEKSEYAARLYDEITEHFILKMPREVPQEDFPGWGESTDCLLICRKCSWHLIVPARKLHFWRASLGHHCKSNKLFKHRNQSHVPWKCDGMKTAGCQDHP